MSDCPAVPCLQDSVPQRPKLKYRRKAVDRDPRTLQARWRRESWTRKSCAVCGRPGDFVLHHARYDGMPSLVLLHIVPLCPFHHRDFELCVWPVVKKWLSRTEATLAYVVHGEALHQWSEWLADDEPPTVGVNRNQLALC